MGSGEWKKPEHVPDLAEFREYLSWLTSAGITSGFQPGITETEEYDLWLNASQHLPAEIVAALRIANGQRFNEDSAYEFKISGYSMLSHEDICWRKQTFDFYFTEEEFPLFEEGNGGFIFTNGRTLKLSNQDGTILREWENLRAFFGELVAGLNSGQLTIETIDLGEWKILEVTGLF